MQGKRKILLRLRVHPNFLAVLVPKQIQTHIKINQVSHAQDICLHIAYYCNIYNKKCVGMWNYEGLSVVHTWLQTVFPMDGVRAPSLSKELHKRPVVQDHLVLHHAHDCWKAFVRELDPGYAHRFLPGRHGSLPGALFAPAA